MVKDNKGFQKKILLITGIFILLLVATGLLNKRNVVEVTSISLEQENVMIEIGRKMVLTGEIMPENATDWVLNWTSSDESVATVSASGEVSAVAAGTATITVKVANTNKRATCTIIVPVAFNNEEFEKQVRLLIGKPDGPIYKTNLAGITSLHLSGENITDINGIENFVDLEVLGIRFTKVSEINGLKGLENLMDLDLGDNKISDIGSLADLVNLNILRLGGNNISDISPLRKLTNLTILDLHSNGITDIDLTIS